MTTRLLNFPHHRRRGFTLVELVTVIVVLSIIALIGGGFIVKSTESYRSSMAHAQLVQQTRQALERASRELRHALPNSIRISSNGRCMEWLPVVAAGHYEGLIAGQEISSLKTTPMMASLDEAYFAVIGALNEGDLYGPQAQALKVLAEALSPGAPPTSSISMAGGVTSFPRDSVAQRVFLVGEPKQLCLHAGRLTLHENYIGTHPDFVLSGSPPNAGVLLAKTGADVALPFQLVAQSEVRNSIVTLTLPIEVDGQQIVLQHKVMVRNVP